MYNKENKENKDKNKSKIPVKKVDFTTENLKLKIPKESIVEYSSDEIDFPNRKQMNNSYLHNPNDIHSSDSSTKNKRKYRRRTNSYRRRGSEKYDYEELDVEDNEKG